MATSTNNSFSAPKAFDTSGHPQKLGAQWTSWLDEFEAYADSVGLFITDANDANKQQRRALLLYTAGKEVRDIFKHLPDTGDPKEYDKAVAALNKHFVLKTNSVFLRHKFRLLRQQTNESVSQYVLRLREAAVGCKFQDVERQIQDQVVEHCTSEKLRRKLLEKGDDLTLGKTLELAALLEAVNLQAEEMKTTAEDTGGTVSRVHEETRHKRECYRCGSQSHFANDSHCPAKGKTCRKCAGRDHFAKMCKSKKRENKESEKRRTRHVETEKDDTDSEKSDDMYVLHLSNSKQKCDYHWIPVKVGGVETNMIVDSGSDMNIIDKPTWEDWKKKQIRVFKQEKTPHRLFPYGCDKPLNLLGSFKAYVEAGSKSSKEKFVIIDGKGEPLLGRETARALGVLKIGLDVRSVNAGGDDFVQEFPELFTGFGKLKDRKIKLHVDPNVKPVAQPVRRTPFGLREKVEAKIQDLLSKDIIEPVDKPSQWVSPIVIVPKPNDDIRVTVDMRRVNEAVLRERHPIPTIDDILHDMAESRVFTKLDLKLGYHQLELEEDSREITTFVTHCGLFRYKRLVMGINAASEIYQHEIQKVIQGIPGVSNLSDDIVVHAPNNETHDARLRKVLNRLKEAGLTLNAEKCKFKRPDIEFLGHRLTANGIDPCLSKVKAVQEAREPENVSEVRSFLGLVNFCGRFIPNLATRAEPLRRLTRKDEPFVFGTEQKKAFQSLKEALSSADTLGFFDPKAKTQVITDASPVGVAAVLVQKQAAGPRVISYASRGLSDVERRYSQTEKEALGIVWACERFHPYIYGLHFELLTDHKPLLAIYGPRSRPSARIERWVLRLQAYSFTVNYIPGKQNIADALSRLLHHPDPNLKSPPVPIPQSVLAEEHVRFLVACATPSAVTAEEMEEASKEDEQIQMVKACIESQKWDECDKAFVAVSPELCIHGSLLLRGPRIVVPKKLQQRILALAHEGHPGIVGTKQNLRTRVWWPGLDKDAEKYVKTCHGCQLVSKADPPEPIKSTVLPTEAWEHLAVDFLGPLPSGHSVLVVVDYYSRYYEIAIMKSTTTQKTIHALHMIFARHGLPLSIRSDNGPQFSSDAFAEYMKSIGAKHVQVTPKWAQANGEVERQNASLLKRMKIAQAEGRNWQEEVLKYLLAYRASPHPSTGRSPSEMLFRRQIRTKLPELKLFSGYDQDVRDRDAEQKGLAKLYADEKRHAKESDVRTGDKVLLRRENTGKLDTPFRPEPCEVISKSGSQVTVQTPDGAVYKRNSTHVKKYNERAEEIVAPDAEIHSPPRPDKQTMLSPVPTAMASETTNGDIPASLATPRPVRSRKPPERLKDYHVNM